MATKASSSEGFLGNTIDDRKNENYIAIKLRNKVMPSNQKVRDERKETSASEKMIEKEVVVEKEFEKKSMEKKSWKKMISQFMWLPHIKGFHNCVQISKIIGHSTHRCNKIYYEDILVNMIIKDAKMLSIKIKSKSHIRSLRNHNFVLSSQQNNLELTLTTYYIRHIQWILIECIIRSLMRLCHVWVDNSYHICKKS